MAVAAYGAARAVGGRVSGVVSGSSDPGRVAGVFLIAGALGLLYLYEQGGLARLWRRTADAATGKTTGGGSLMTPQGAGQDPNRPGGTAGPPALPPVTGQEQQLYQQHYAHPLTQPPAGMEAGPPGGPPYVYSMNPNLRNWGRP